MRTHFKLVAIDETYAWSPDVVAEAGKLVAIYLFDSNRHHHCEELRASYELHGPIYTLPLREVSDKVSEYLLDEGAQHQVAYHLVKDIDRLPADRFYDYGLETQFDHDAKWDDVMEDYYEQARCNWVMGFPPSMKDAA